MIVWQQITASPESTRLMKPYRVVITDFVTEPLDVEREILGDLATVEALGAERESQLEGRIEEADAIMMYHFLQVGEPTLRRLKQCQLIVRCGVGTDNVDWRLARELGIPVANVPDYGTEEVADSAIGMLLTLTRGIHVLNSRLRQGAGEWTYQEAGEVRRLRGRTLGIIGIGRIGTATALRAKALGLRVLFHDPYVPEGIDKALGVERANSLEELLAASDIVSLHCPLTEETRHLINSETLAGMKPGAFLINTARGAVVDPLAVLQGLEEGRLAGAGLDVLETEPPDPAHPLIQAWRNADHPAFDRLIINPHAAFYSEEGLLDMRVKGSENCRRVLSGELPRNVIG